MNRSPLIDRLADRLFGKRIIQNNFRGELVEEIVATALEPEWKLCGGDWGSCDLIRPRDGVRIQVKQSAARQSWHAAESRPAKPVYSIASKAGRWEGAIWIEEKGRNADIFIFGWHPIEGEDADHRDPAQWLSFVVAECDLPDQQSVALSALKSRCQPVMYDALLAEVTRVGERSVTK